MELVLVAPLVVTTMEWGGRIWPKRFVVLNPELLHRIQPGWRAVTGVQE